jgi:hypothetical protein
MHFHRRNPRELLYFRVILCERTQKVQYNRHVTQYVKSLSPRTV